MGETQTQWLRRELEAATARREKVIVASHIALSPTAARPGMSAWRSDEVSQTLESFDCVKVCVAGHDHPGGYGRTLVPDREGKYRTFGRVHYVTLEAMLEAPEGSTSYATMEVYDHEVSVVGVGQATSRRLQTSEDGVFTGVASFGERISDVMDDGGGVGRDGTDGDIVSRGGWADRTSRSRDEFLVIFWLFFWLFFWTPSRVRVVILRLVLSFRVTCTWTGSAGTPSRSSRG